MIRDPIVNEVRQCRQNYAKKFHYDLRAICKDLRQQQQSSGHNVITLQAKRRATKEAQLPSSTGNP